MERDLLGRRPLQNLLSFAMLSIETECQNTIEGCA
jgi:hypothetical protein